MRKQLNGVGQRHIDISSVTIMECLFIFLLWWGDKSTYILGTHRTHKTMAFQQSVAKDNNTASS